MEKIQFTDTIETNSAFVTIDGENYDVHPATYEGGTDLSAETFNTMQNNIENSIQRDITTGGEPVKCGYKIDGKDVYVKRIDCGYLNGDFLQVPHNINESFLVIKLEGAVINEANKNQMFTIPRSFINNIETYNIDCDITQNYIEFNSGTAYINTFRAYVNIYFVYNS